MRQLIIRIILEVLFRGLCVLYREDSRVKKELDAYPNGYRFCFLISQTPLSLSFEKREGGLKKVSGTKGDLVILFKGVRAAFLVFCGLSSVPQAYAQHRFVLKGCVHEGLGLVRCIAYAEGYLFPKFMLRRILERIPEKELPSRKVYGKILFFKERREAL